MSNNFTIKKLEWFNKTTKQQHGKHGRLAEKMEALRNASVQLRQDGRAAASGEGAQELKRKAECASYDAVLMEKQVLESLQDLLGQARGCQSQEMQRLSEAAKEAQSATLEALEKSGVTVRKGSIVPKSDAERRLGEEIKSLRSWNWNAENHQKAVARALARMDKRIDEAFLKL